jgi:HK97 family phage portal protein
MSYLSQLLGTPTPQAASLDADLGYMLAASQTASGASVNATSALKISTVWACVRLISETIASLPAFVYERLPDGGRQRATNHPLYDLLHSQPNDSQTAFEFFEMMTGHVLLRGNAYARIVPGARGFADQLIPVHPDEVTPEKVPGTSKLRYRVQGFSQPFNDDEILHLRGLSSDGYVGLDPITYARESFGLTMAGEKYGARFFGNNSIPGGILSTDKGLKPDTAKRIKESWEASQVGGNNHRVAVLEEGLKWQAIGVDPRNAQFLELREFQAEDVCRWFRVPPHMVGLTSKSTSWGSGIEQQSIGFVTYSLVPWLVRWQQALSRDLILAPQTYFVEFLVAGLLRGDLKSRFEAYNIARNGGWYSANDVRRLENENPIEGGDDYLVPLNMGVVGAPAPALPAASADGQQIRAAWPADHYAALLREAAARVVRKETMALGKVARRGESIIEAAAEFYADHADFVAQTLHISAERAARYVAGQLAELSERGAEAMADWPTRKVQELIEVTNG